MSDKEPVETTRSKGGRPPGSPNKITRDVRDMITGALSDAGGRAYLARQATENPGPFLTLVGRIVPKEIHATVDLVVSLDYSKREPDAVIEDAHTRAMPQKATAAIGTSTEIVLGLPASVAEGVE